MAEKDADNRGLTPRLRSCRCSHAYQDKQYGAYKRLHNPMARKKTQTPRYRCTVCGATRD